MRFRFWFVVSGALTGIGFSACGSSSDPVHAGLASGCTLNSDCATPLVCAFEHCHKQCSSSRDCSDGELCVAAAPGLGVCQLPDEATCTNDASCKRGQVCVQGTCRLGCRDESACLASQTCQAFACVDRESDGGVEPDGGTPAACATVTLDNDCPANACRHAVACSAEGECVYEPLTPAGCGSCGLGTPNCTDPANPACADIDLLGVSAGALECDSTKPSSTFVYLDPRFSGASSDGSAGKPFTLLSDALAAASTSGRGPTTIIIAGSPLFEDTLVLPDGVSLRGGYDDTDNTGAFAGVWRRNLSSRPLWNVRDTHVSNNLLIGLRAEHIHLPTIIANVTIQTQPLRGVGSAEGATNIGLLANDADGLHLFDVTVLAGDAQAGAQGAIGADATNGPSVTGGSGAEQTTGSKPTVHAGVSGAHNAACDVPDSQGGDGGDVGPAVYPGHDAPGGAKGDSGTGAQDGATVPGIGSTGSDGTGDASVSASALFTPLGAGSTGADGATGRGGGGGKSNYGENTAAGSFYATPGGSGGAGGCGGHGGLGGLPGGWSIGFLAVASPGLIVRGGSFNSAAGGNGGTGNTGGAGAPGGVGGNFTNSPSGIPNIPSTKGGHGSTGQQGGPGGTGAGGSSVGIYCSSTTPTIEQSPTFVAGTVGAGGSPVSASATVGCGI